MFVPKIAQRLLRGTQVDFCNIFRLHFGSAS
jgi:hypothetical protein